MSDAEQRNKIVKVLKGYPGITANMDLTINSALVVDLARVTQPTQAEAEPVDGKLREQIADAIFGKNGCSVGSVVNINLVLSDLEQLFSTHLQAAVSEALVNFVSWYNQNYDNSYSSGIAEGRPGEYLQQLKRENLNG